MINRLDMYVDRFRAYAPLVLRIGIGFVFAWFGWNAISAPDSWVRLVPDWQAAIIDARTLVLVHGAVELVLGVLLIVGARIRLVSGILLLSILHTLFLISGPSFIRDVGIAAATLSIFLSGGRSVLERISPRI